MNSVWMQRLAKWTTKYQQMMRGRYGQFDSLNKFLLVVACIGLLLNPFIPFYLGRWFALAAIGFVYYRLFSKKIYPRSNENQRFVRLKNNILGRLQKVKTRWQQRKTYSYFRCPDCKQELRAPKGRGTIRVTCSSCQHQFQRNV